MRNRINRLHKFDYLFVVLSHHACFVTRVDSSSSLISSLVEGSGFYRSRGHVLGSLVEGLYRILYLSEGLINTLVRDLTASPVGLISASYNKLPVPTIKPRFNLGVER